MALLYKVGQTVIVGHLDPSFDWDELEQGMEVVINQIQLNPYGLDHYYVTPVGKETYPLRQALRIGDDEISGLSPEA